MEWYEQQSECCPIQLKSLLKRIGDLAVEKRRCTMVQRKISDIATLSSPPGGTTAYQRLHHSINRQVANMFAKNDANLALSPTFCYVSIESPL
ncbi:hypothetical protein TNCV_4705511 [Trichonephila clavipes]|nr:hypothetical protein TNCV_4705511 [Trichonephila clavipes]